MNISQIRPKLAATGAIVALAVVGSTVASQPANAWWHGGYGYGGWCCSVGIALPPIVVAPPPVYAPAPAYYAPPPAYYAPPTRAWIPAHWENGYWVPGHWS